MRIDLRMTMAGLTRNYASKLSSPNRKIVKKERDRKSRFIFHPSVRVSLRVCVVTTGLSCTLRAPSHALEARGEQTLRASKNALCKPDF